MTKFQLRRAVGGGRQGHFRRFRSDSTNPKSSLFNFVLVSGAGHEVPSYRPNAALWMLRSFVLGNASGR